MKLRFPQGFVEKCKNDKICEISCLWHKTVALLNLHPTYPHFVLKILTNFQQWKRWNKVNKIKDLLKFSTFSTRSIIYYNYYFIYYLFHSFHYIACAREKRDFFSLTKSCRPAKKKCNTIQNRREMPLWYICTSAAEKA